jgi:hypothetical protein
MANPLTSHPLPHEGAQLAAETMKLLGGSSNWSMDSPPHSKRKSNFGMLSQLFSLGSEQSDVGMLSPESEDESGKHAL